MHQQMSDGHWHDHHHYNRGAMRPRTRSGCDRNKPQPVAELDAAPYRAVMFTDIVGSTAIGVDFGDRVYLSLIQQHDRIARAAVASFGGVVFDTAGDGLLAWFDDPSIALRASLTIAGEVTRQAPVRPGVSLAVRIGLADGHPLARRNSLFGTTVNLAARVVDQAPPGRVVCTKEMSRRAEADHFGFEPMGGRFLKGFNREIGLVAVS